MTLVEELERAGAAGSRLSPGQRPVSAVMAADARGMRVYLVALGGAGAAFSYLVVDVRGHPVVSRRAVREAVTLIALAERADEVAGALAGEVVAAAFAD
ncbi:MAG TPA: hypothetical protein VMU66_00030, partial [Gaiellales bacterium]|nr:hypothetical protein [Gaiellales bacterium]